MKKSTIHNILKVLAVGGAAAGLGAAGIGLVSMAIWIYCTIPVTCGYVAVSLFALATLTLAAALGVVYVCGCWIIRKGKFAR